MRITEHELDGFRAKHLSPAAILRALEQYVRVLLRLPVGAGKSFAAVALLLCDALYRRYDLVVYAAPAWDILGEVIARVEEADSAPRSVVIRRRPVELCGDLDKDWREYEETGCFALAKARICRERCPHAPTCAWPKQLQKIKGVRLVLMTEQRLDLVRTMVPLLQARTGGRRVLVILDEARTLDANFDVVLLRHHVDRFRDVIMRTRSKKSDWAAMRGRWIGELDRLMSSTASAFGEREFTFPDLGKFALAVQSRGWADLGREFRYLGHQLPLLGYTQQGERWVEDEEFHFIARPLLRAHVLFLSAHITGAYAGHRLGHGPVASPFEDVQFAHTGTRIINVRNRCGADRHFRGNRERILDTFAVAIMRNVLDGRTTLLVSKKKSKKLCVDYLASRLAGWGVEVRFVLEGDALPAAPDPRVIPVIHYGVLGVNDYSEYQSCYCVNSYYVRSSELNRTVQEFEPKHFRSQLVIVTTTDRRREVRVQTSDVTDAERAWLGEVYLRKLEVDPVIQAVGRVRFLTKPREVVFFQMNDLERDLGPIQEVGSLGELRSVLGIPSARSIDDALVGKRSAELMTGGATAAEAAAKLGIARATLFRRLESIESLKKHKRIYLRVVETPPAFLGAPGGVLWS